MSYLLLYQLTAAEGVEQRKDESGLSLSDNGVLGNCAKICNLPLKKWKSTGI
jgi:hypothetical protein